jgi:hypothetical protein
MDKILNTLPDNHISNETLWTYKDNIEIFNKFNQSVIHYPQEPPPKAKEEPPPKAKEEPIPKAKEEHIPKTREEPPLKKNKIESPIDLIMRLTEIDRFLKQDIKLKLIDFISIPEFSKAFGIKKSAEIMTALSKDSWNQSISLFISFLLDKNIIYKEKSYVYNKDNNDAVINVC